MIDVSNKKNVGRQNELDVARGLAVIFMVLIHMLLELSNRSTQEESIYGILTQLLGGVPAAPVFMFLLGVGIIYSRKNTPGLLVKRGLTLVAAGYILNLFRSVIPAWINTFLGFESPVAVSNLVYENLFYIDILQFAGLAMLFFAVSLYFNFSIREYMLVLLLFMIFNLFMLPYIPYYEATAVAPFTALLFGNDFSYFPFFTWIAYPIGGYLFGTYLIQTGNKFEFYKRVFKVTSIILVAYSVCVVLFNFPTGYESDSSYYHHTIIVNLVYILFILFWISILYFISNKLHGLGWTFLKSASALTTEIYFIHFLFIGLYAVLIHQKLGLGSTLLLTVLTYVFSHYMAYLFVKLKANKINHRQERPPLKENS
ncbi:heparan-alpha-glucosaminide N-acetyltransferase domain-containing protein [Paenibacillus radicis (ex Gao et al. 2016)]|uniref:Heparan-alpha-glucosaminide N-acetyltransferase catalytic domain-containing protein n=1 Tax=Paenibacillus radicis (ex Gao et al. 2016) TaxID=1737354 RepID=A0A917HJG2_9BACL|nr:heparan-alpha-glucosaminide N-acetyltransferase domain-containing protein [Paenibacillus radicis (ex Gao et al. 2016)]GGG81530.1 hypothetical protein GCM10010918_43500 [Paenibacillus radicis (ex Gao et al. 2016)]